MVCFKRAMRREPCSLALEPCSGYAASWRLPVLRAAGSSVSSGAFWMGRDDGARTRRRATACTCTTCGSAHSCHQARVRGLPRRAGAHHLPGREGELPTGTTRTRRIHVSGGVWIADAGFDRHPAVGLVVRRARLMRVAVRRCPPSRVGRRLRAATQTAVPVGHGGGRRHRAVFGRPTSTAVPRRAGRPGAGPSGVEDLLGLILCGSGRPTRCARTLPQTATARYLDGPGRFVVRGASPDGGRDREAIPAAALHLPRALDESPRLGAAAGHPSCFRCATDPEIGARWLSREAV